MTNTLYDPSLCKRKLSQIFLSYFRRILDLKDFITNIVLAIGEFAPKRLKSDRSRYVRYSLEYIVRWDQSLVFEMCLVKIISELERFLKSYFYEIGKINEKYRQGFSYKLLYFSNYVSKEFHLHISEQFDQWQELLENYYRRNMFVHNRGRIGRDYIKYVHTCSPERKGEPLKMDLNYMTTCIGNILSFFEFIHESMISYFHLSDMEQILVEINEKRKYGIDISYFTKFALRERAKI